MVVSNYFFTTYRHTSSTFHHTNKRQTADADADSPIFRALSKSVKEC